MSVIAAALRELMAAGVAGEALASAIERIEAATAPMRSPRQERNRRYYENKRLKTSEQDASDDQDAAPSPPSSLSPRPPILTTPTPERDTTRARKADDFAAFWEAYPRKVAKADARRAWDRHVGKAAGPDPPQILAALDRAKANWTDAQFIPHPATWLNGGRWDDEPTTLQPRPTPLKAHERPDQPSAKRAAREDNYARAFAGSEAATRMRTVG